MTARVIDASVVAAAFFPEKHSAAARAVLRGTQELLVPDLLFAEMANVIWKRQQRREIDSDEAGQLIEDVLMMPWRITPSNELAAAALEIAMRTARTVYDCLYLALAVRSGEVLVTADKRLVNALTSGPLEGHISWLGEKGIV